MLKQHVHEVEQNKWRHNLQQKGDCARYLRVQTDLKVNTLYHVTKNNIEYIHSIQILLKCFSITVTNDIIKCELCDRYVPDDVTKHLFCECPKFRKERNEL